jgi:hypothetical protein
MTSCRSGKLVLTAGLPFSVVRWSNPDLVP